MPKPVILTGLRANNDLHLGNYFGALQPIIKMAHEKANNYQINLFVPDLHSFTTPVDHDNLYLQTINNIKLFVAAGLPYRQSGVFIYRQSFIPAHSQLAWILDCFSGVGEMNRMTQFKDKRAKGDDNRASMGLLNYPVLMAADILLYEATLVPVGDDQKQHLEFTRDIAGRLNSKFGQLFTIPESYEEQLKFFKMKDGLRIKSLADPTKKMSKSDQNDRGAIFLSDSPEKAKQKVLSATTDSLASISYDPAKQPGISNLLQLLALLTDRSLQEVVGEWQSKSNYGELKQAVGDACSQFLSSFQEKLSSINEDDILKKLSEDEKAMSTQASNKLEAVQRAVGLRQ